MAEHKHWCTHLTIHKKKLIFIIIINLLITILQASFGFLSGSLSLLSDALHNLSDVISLVISYGALVLSTQKKTLQRTYGFRRAEIVAAFINAATLFALAIPLTQEAIQRAWQPQVIDATSVIGMAIVSIFVNGGSALLLHKHSHDNLNFHSAYLHLASDFITSVAVLLGGIFMHYAQVYWVDSLLSVLIAFYLVILSWKLLLQTLGVIMQFAPKDVSAKDIEQKVLSYPDVQNIHHMHIWQITDQTVHLEAHIDLKNDLPLSQVTVLLAKIKEDVMQSFRVHHIIFQPEIGTSDAKTLIAEDDCL